MFIENLPVLILNTLVLDRANNYLAPGIKLTIKLSKASDDFLLIRGPDTLARFKIKVHDIRLYYYRIRVSNRVPRPRIEHYMIARTELATYPVPMNMRNQSIKIFSGGTIPKSVVFTQVSHIYNLDEVHEIMHVATAGADCRHRRELRREPAILPPLQPGVHQSPGQRHARPLGASQTLL